ncbi:MAG: low specificity L-threonine aldolase [Planctomycetes bacterium]|nr:low specificity L-threonine aldolase [Planctomycetota bacterium]
MIDLRSDTVTRPGAAMRRAMAEAEVGDDVIDVDPTVERLERSTAEILGKDAALFMPSGSMSNQIAVRIHCKPGDEFLCDVNCHIYNYEQAAFAQLSGVVARTVEGEHGVLQLGQLVDLIRPINDHLARTRLVCLENTHNRGAGRVQPYDVVESICGWARERGLRTHLDGARLFNAVVATGIAADAWARHFDTVSVCFSKGLGAPVGSALAGPSDMIREARRHRKLFGGGMRQAGVIAAGALYGLEHHRERLAEDHEKASRFAAAVRQCESLRLVPDRVDTNIVIFEVDRSLGTAAAFVDSLEQRGVRMLPVSASRVRAVTHLDVSAEDVDLACGLLTRTADAMMVNSR